MSDDGSLTALSYRKTADPGDGGGPSCVATLPAAAALLAKARAAGATVVYSETNAAGSEILPQVAPQPVDPIVKAHADKFFATDLDQILSSRGIQTLVVNACCVSRWRCGAGPGQ